MSRGLCYSCRTLGEMVTVDQLERGLCADCVDEQPPSREQLLATYLVNTIPFSVGDRVEGRTAAEHYDGIGVIEEISTDPKDLATSVIPMFRVRMIDKAYPEVPDEIWFSEVCLTKVKVDA